MVAAGGDGTMVQRVLVVDDEPDVAFLCRVNLEMEGYEVLTADDGQTAVEVVGAEHPDAVLLDIMLPRLDGWSVLSAIRADPSTAEIPVVIMSAKPREGRSLEGAIEYIEKPFSRDQLVRAVRGAVTGDASET
ncbi:MAG: response regulator [Actinobacteria bacterium]|nr:MAG: response regulator [Actinomycetota bacterium]